MDYTKITLGELLSYKNDTIRRNAVSILKQIQKNEPLYEAYHRKVQNFGEQHPEFNTKEHLEWLENNK